MTFAHQNSPEGVNSQWSRISRPFEFLVPLNQHGLFETVYLIKYGTVSSDLVVQMEVVFG